MTASGCTGKSGIFTVIFDTGSDRSYVSSRLVKRVEPEWVGTQPISYSAFGTDHGGKGELRNLSHVNLTCADDSYVSLFATGIPTICTPTFRSTSCSRLRSCPSKPIDCSDGGEVQVDVLIGLDSYWKFMKSGIGLVAQESVFGWVLSGSLVDDGESPSVVSHQLLCFNEVPEAALHKFWDLESIGISDAPVEAAYVSAVFKQQIKYVDGRYEMGFPWTPGMADTLQENEKLARVRLESLNRRLARDNSDLAGRYDSVLQEMENERIIEEVPIDEKVSPHATYYMPHHPVIKESSSSTKVRPVFDASAQWCITE